MILVLLTVALLEGVHAALVQKIKEANPDLCNALGNVGPGYYFFGLFWFSPTYRRFLISGRLASELLPYPKLARLSQIEVLLWYAMWLTIAIAIFGAT